MKDSLKLSGVISARVCMCVCVYIGNGQAYSNADLADHLRR